MSWFNRVRLTSHDLQQQKDHCAPTVLLRVVEASGGYADSNDVEGARTWPNDLHGPRTRAEKRSQRVSVKRKRGSQSQNSSSMPVDAFSKQARTRLAMMSFSGPTTRQDAARAEKSRWLGYLAALLVGTQTPLGQRRAQKRAACNTTGLGLRSGTLRNRAQALLLRPPSHLVRRACWAYSMGSFLGSLFLEPPP